jgi:hypothetical protein
MSHPQSKGRIQVDKSRSGSVECMPRGGPKRNNLSKN